MNKTEQKRLINLLEKFENESKENYNSSIFDLSKIREVINLIKESE